MPAPGHRPGPPLRASAADREQAVDILRVAAGDGRLTLAELDERLEGALSARTIGELVTLTADLPGGRTLHAAAVRPAALHPVAPHPARGAEPSRWALLRSLV
jgi:hypothetical protein